MKYLLLLISLNAFAENFRQPAEIGIPVQEEIGEYKDDDEPMVDECGMGEDEYQNPEDGEEILCFEIREDGVYKSHYLYKEPTRTLYTEEEFLEEWELVD